MRIGLFSEIWNVCTILLESCALWGLVCLCELSPSLLFPACIGFDSLGLDLVFVYFGFTFALCFELLQFATQKASFVDVRGRLWAFGWFWLSVDLCIRITATVASGICFILLFNLRVRICRPLFIRLLYLLLSFHKWTTKCRPFSYLTVLFTQYSKHFLSPK